VRTTLILTNAKDVTADYLCDRLNANGVCYCRLDTENLPDKGSLEYSTAKVSLTVENASFSPEDIGAIWLRRPMPIQLSALQSAESIHGSWEWSEALEGFLAHIPPERWINHPARNILASHKSEQLTRARANGFRTPDTLITQDHDTVLAFWNKYRGRVIAKPLAAGYIERADYHEDTVIYTHSVSETDLANAELLARCPTLFQEQIEKKCDVRVVVLDGQIVATRLSAKESDGHQRLDIRRRNMSDVVYDVAELSDSQKIEICSFVKSYGLRFAALDFAMTETGELIFFEINPNGQWAWLDLAANTNIADLFVKAFTKNES
jgi:glutathione synthase/RimK-type ligase-like ATP-grasp enzyme